MAANNASPTAAPPASSARSWLEALGFGAPSFNRDLEGIRGLGDSPSATNDRRGARLPKRSNVRVVLKPVVVRRPEIDSTGSSISRPVIAAVEVVYWRRQLRIEVPRDGGGSIEVVIRLRWRHSESEKRRSEIEGVAEVSEWIHAIGVRKSKTSARRIAAEIPNRTSERGQHLGNREYVDCGT